MEATLAKELPSGDNQIDFESLLGIFLCLFAAILNNLGMIIMKKSFNIKMEEAKSSEIRVNNALDNKRKISVIITSPVPIIDAADGDNEIQKPYFLDYIWITGMVLFIIGQVISVVALTFISQILWATLSLFSLVINAVFASILLNERFTRDHLFYTVIIIIGCMLVVISSEFHEREYNIEQLKILFVATPFICYISITFILLVVNTVFAIYRIKNNQPVDAAIWAVFGAIMGSISILLGKCSTELVKSAVQENSFSNFEAPSTYAILVVFVLSAIGSVHGMNMALAGGEAIIIIPLIGVTNTVLVILGGIFYFQELRTLNNPWRCGLFISGIMLSVAGSFFLARVTTPPESQEPRSSEDSMPLLSEIAEHKYGATLEIS